MISRLPLDLFDDRDDADDPLALPEAPADDVDLVVAPVPVEDVLEDIVLATCQWCAESFDNELDNCPHCNAKHIKLATQAAEPTTVTCQWCLTTFDIGPTDCPECNARVVVPGQNVPGEHDVPLNFNAMGVMAQRAHSNQMLAGMMLGGGLDSLAAGLIGLALTLWDDD